MKEIIICAAVKYGEKVWLGHRHFQALQAMKDELSYTMNRKQMQKKGVGNEQGFVTSLNRYVDRIDGYQIALASNQVRPETGKVLLYSEDLY